MSFPPARPAGDYGRDAGSQGHGHVVGRDSQDFRDFRLWNSFQREAEHLTLQHIEVLQAAQQLFRFLLRGGLPFRARRRVGNLGRVVEPDLGALAPDQRRDGAIVRDAQQKRSLRALAAEIRPGAPGGEPDLLREILPVRGIALVQGCHARDRRPMHTHQLLEPGPGPSRDVPVLAAFDAANRRSGERGIG
jgi:hypothetical protein